MESALRHSTREEDHRSTAGQLAGIVISTWIPSYVVVRRGLGLRGYFQKGVQSRVLNRRRNWSAVRRSVGLSYRPFLGRRFHSSSPAKQNKKQSLRSTSQQMPIGPHTAVRLSQTRRRIGLEKKQFELLNSAPTRCKMQSFNFKEKRKEIKLEHAVKTLEVAKD